MPSRNIEISEWKSVDQEGSRVLAFRRLDVTASAPRRQAKAEEALGGLGGRSRTLAAMQMCPDAFKAPFLIF